MITRYKKKVRRRRGRRLFTVVPPSKATRMTPRKAFDGARAAKGLGSIAHSINFAPLTPERITKLVEMAQSDKPIEQAINYAMLHASSKTSPSTRLKTGTRARTVTPKKVEVKVDGINGDTIDVLHRQSTSVKKRYVGNVASKIYHHRHAIKSPRSKWIRSLMKQFPKTKVVLRDDDAGVANNYMRRLYSTCGINRKGVYFPVSDQNNAPLKPYAQWASTLSNNSMLTFPQNRYNYQKIWYPLGFMGADYEAFLTLRPWVDYYNGADVVDRETTDFVLPLTKKHISLQITNRNAFTPCKVTVYLVRRKDASITIPAVGIATGASLVVPQETMPLEYVYSPAAPVFIIKDDGTEDTGASFTPETSIHLKSTPIMGRIFSNYFDVVSVYKKILNASDILHYDLSVDCNGFSLQRRSGDFNSSGSNENTVAINRFLRGDYQFIVTFEGLPKFTAGYQKYDNTDPQNPFTSYPSQMAVSGVTNPCEIDIRTRVAMECHMEDYWQRKVQDTDRLANYDGSPAWFSVSNNIARDRLEASSANILVRKPRSYNEQFNVPYSSVVTTSDPTKTGYYVEVPSDIEYKNINTNSTPT